MKPFNIMDSLLFVKDNILLRGERLYEDDCVTDISVNGNIVTAKVHGSVKYITEAHFTHDKKVAFRCSCPYDRGICKHAVALAFEIDNDSSIFEKISFDKEKKAVSKSDIDSLINSAEINDLKSFLSEMFSENTNLFERFRTLITGQTKAESNTGINELLQEIVDELESFDLVDYQRFYEYEGEYSGYRDDWEMLFDGAQAELEELFKTFSDKISFYLETGNVIESVKHLLALFESVNTAKVQDIQDEANIFDGNMADELQFHFKYFYNDFIKKLTNIKTNYDAFCRITDIITERIIHYQKTLKEDSFLYDLRQVEQILILKTDDRQKAEYLKKRLDHLAIPSCQTSSTYEKIFSLLEDETCWLKLAENQYKNNADIAEKLLVYYENNRKEFVRIANDVAFLFKFRFIPYLSKNLKQEDNPDLYKKVLFQLVSDERTISNFRKIKTSLTTEDVNEFIEIIKHRGFFNFFVSVLSNEKRYAEILEFARKRKYDYDINSYIKPIITIYPDECFKIISTVIRTALKKTGSAEHYRAEANRLRILLNSGNENLKEKVYGLAENLLSQYSRRTAMKREFRNMGVVRPV